MYIQKKKTREVEFEWERIKSKRKGGRLTQAEEKNMEEEREGSGRGGVGGEKTVKRRKMRIEEKSKEKVPELALCPGTFQTLPWQA